MSWRVTETKGAPETVSCNTLHSIFVLRSVWEVTFWCISAHFPSKMRSDRSTVCVCVHKQVDSVTAGGYLYVEWDGANRNQDKSIKSYTQWADVQMSDVLFYFPQNFNQKPISNYALVSCTVRMSTTSFANKHRSLLEAWSKFMEVCNTKKVHGRCLHIHSQFSMLFIWFKCLRFILNW